MLRRLNLSVTWGTINKYSSDTSLCLFNLYLQHSIINFLEFTYLYLTAGYCTTKLHNKEKYIVKYHLPPNHSSTQTPPSILVRLLEQPIPMYWSQWPPQPRPRHFWLPWRPENMIPELYLIGYSTRRRRSPGGSGILIWSEGWRQNTPSTFMKFWSIFDIFHCL